MFFWKNETVHIPERCLSANARGKKGQFRIKSKEITV